MTMWQALVKLAGLVLLALLPCCQLQAHEPVTNPDFHLEVAKAYEALEDWKNAEEHYLAAGRSGSPAVQEEALEGIKRVLERRRQRTYTQGLDETLDRLANLFDKLAGHFGRVLGFLGALVALALLIYWIATSRQVRRTIRIEPFTAKTDEDKARIGFYLAAIQSRLRMTNSIPGMIPTTAPLPFLHLPSLSGELPDIGNVEVAGVKVPLADILRVVRRPRVRVSGRWLEGQAFADIERRDWFSYRPVASTHRDIPTYPRASQSRALELFAYEVFIQAVKAHVS